ncbi:MAG: aminopeptidase N [Gammaproteobacteria bacterium]|nr:aminopeptidase N [Gammaproteobacteria bacterium]
MQNKSKDEPHTIYLKDYHVPPYYIDEIDLRFELNNDFSLVTSHLRIRSNPLSQQKEKNLFLNGEELTLISLKLNNKPLTTADYEVTDQCLMIRDVPDHFELEICTKIYPQKNKALSGLYRSATTYCTQCEAEGFRRITYFIDRPDVLSRYTTTIIADEKAYPSLLSNGNKIASGKLENGLHWVKWEDPFKKPSYLFALVAGDFDVLKDKFLTQSGREVSLQIYVEKGYGDQANHAMDCVKEAMKWDEKAYGREYDLDIYMIVAIGDFNMGAMENKGLNIFNTKYILAKPETATDDDYIHILSVIGHEYFHNWSGNRVTCRDWFQLSLKEGLTIFRDQSFSEDTLSPGVMRIRDVNALREVQFPEDAGPLSHPVRPDAYIEINNFYTATIYNKGAEVLRMLQTILGKTLFRKGMDLYFSRYDGQAVTIEDFVKTMEEVSGLNLQQFRLWYSQSGTPIITVEDDYDSNQKIYTLTLHQSGAHKKNYQALHVPVRMGLLDQKGNAMSLSLADGPTETEKVLQLTKLTEVFQFKNIAERPVPSLLRNFSAPVKLNYSYSDEQLQFLFKYDKDAFNRYEAGQNYALRILLNLVNQYQQNETLDFSPALAEMYEYVLSHDATDKLFLAELLSLPSEKYIGEQMEIIDVDAIHAAREFIRTEIAKRLQTSLLKMYETHQEHSTTFQFNVDTIGKRHLKNLALNYLMLLPNYIDLGMKQFESAFKVNMTDTQAALVGLANTETPLRENALSQFYNAWKQDALVVDKWLAIQAASKLPQTLSQVRKLMHHEAFDIKNPNKVYALIGTFANRNPIHFHALNGEGYAFLRDVVQQIDSFNPQIAARMVKPLTTWKRYDKERQEQMREQLSLLLHKKISNDLYELVTKSLE